MKIIQCIIACFLFTMSIHAQPTEVRFKYWKPIDRAAGKEEEIVAIKLDSDIYAATRAGYPDIRVVDEANAEAPYVIEPEVEFRKERTRQSFATDIVALKPDGNAIEVHLKLPEKASDAEGFNFATPLINYERKIKVTGSVDGKKWTPVVEGVIFDYSQYMDVSSREINLPKNNYREFKITIEDVTDEKESPFKELTRTFKDAKEAQRVERTVIERRAFRIDRITAWGVTTREAVQQTKTATYPVAKFDTETVADTKRTMVTVRTRREPITWLTLETPSRNFSLRAVIEVPAAVLSNPDQRKRPKPKRDDTEPGWHAIAEATIENFSFRNEKREQLSITIPERREEQFRIVIHNEDNPPLNITAVKAEGSVQRLIFLAQPAKRYRVLYGSESVPAPKYEAATVLATLRKDNTPVLAGLGEQKDNTEFGGEPAAKTRSIFNNWIFLGGAIGLMVIVLAWTLFRAGKRLENLPKE